MTPGRIIMAWANGVVITKGKARRAALDILNAHRFEMQMPMPMHPDRHWHVVTNSDRTAFAVISHGVDTDTPIDLELFLVLPEHRGRGVGAAFLRALAATYGALGGECYEPEQVAFYRRAGCRVTPLDPKKTGRLAQCHFINTAPLCREEGA
jgi:GNAT superfamily N-acetyltransferase